MSISQSPLQDQSPLQETFGEAPGEAPIEAMAAGLPMVVTDWDGSRDTVRRGEDGILVPTLMAPSGDGREASLRQATSKYIGTWLSLTARLTAVDIGVVAEAFRALAADPSLRRMGAAGQARAKGTFDWAAVIPLYRGTLPCGGSSRRSAYLRRLAELNRRGETTVRELLEVMEPTRRSAGQRAVLWLLRVRLAV